MNRAEKRRQKKLSRKSAKRTSQGQPGLQQTQATQQALGLAIQHHNAGNLAKAEAIYRQILQSEPNHPAAWHLLGLIANEAGNYEFAVECITKAIALHPEFAEAHNNLGVPTQNLGRLEEAISHFRKAIDIKPDYAEAHNNLAQAFQDCGQFKQALTHFRKAIDIKPDYAEAHSNLLIAMHYDECAPDELYQEHKAWNERHAVNLQAPMYKNEKGTDPEKPLHVGFVSGDFREHSVAYFLGSFFEAYNRQGLVFHCYSNSTQEDAITTQLRDAVDVWRNITGLDDQSVAEMIRTDQIDILVDLSGHTKGHRLPVFARKPAPIQVTWLGYPNTTGLTAIDYRITDSIADPPGQSDKFCAERLVRLPDGFLCYRPPDNAPQVSPLPMAKKGKLTFVSFNNLSKVTPGIMKAWAQVLDAVPGSVLMIKGKSFTCPEVCRSYMSFFEKESIASERVILLPRNPSTQEHFAMYGQADIALDTFPYNGTTTTCEALWMGVPVVVLRGESHVARVGASLLTQVGLESLIAENIDGYIEKAVSLANDVKRLETLRKEMRARIQSSLLCDASGFAKNMETAFRKIWKEWCDSGAGQ